MQATTESYTIAYKGNTGFSSPIELGDYLEKAEIKGSVVTLKDCHDFF